MKAFGGFGCVFSPVLRLPQKGKRKGAQSPFSNQYGRMLFLLKWKLQIWRYVEILHFQEATIIHISANCRNEHPRGGYERSREAQTGFRSQNRYDALTREPRQGGRNGETFCLPVSDQSILFSRFDNILSHCPLMRSLSTILSGMLIGFRPKATIRSIVSFKSRL